jgi:hypothetical protein
MLKQLTNLAAISLLACAPVLASDCAEGYLFAGGNEVVRLPKMIAAGSFGTLITRSGEGWTLQNGSLEVASKSRSVVITTAGKPCTVSANSKAAFEQVGGAYEQISPTVKAGKLTAQVTERGATASKFRPVQMILKDTCRFSMESPFHMHLDNGVMLINAPSGIVVDTAEGTVQAPPGSAFVLAQSFGGVRLMCATCTEPIRFILAEKQIALFSSEELFVCNHRPMQFEVTPDDGVGRKSIKLIDLGESTTGVTSVFSIPTMLRSPEYFQQWTRDGGQHSRLSYDLLKTAAAVSFARQTTQSFYVAPRSNTF